MNPRFFSKVVGSLPVIVSVSVFAQTTVPNDFVSGAPARASEVNQNFDVIEAAIDENTGEILQNRAQIQQNQADIQQLQQITAASNAYSLEVTASQACFDRGVTCGTPIPASVLAQYCGEPDGCLLSMIAYSPIDTVPVVAIPDTRNRLRLNPGGVTDAEYVEQNNPATWLYTSEGVWTAIGDDDEPEGACGACIFGVGVDNNSRPGLVYRLNHCELTDGDVDEFGRFDPNQGVVTLDVSPGLTLSTTGGNPNPEFTAGYKCTLVLRD